MISEKKIQCDSDWICINNINLQFDLSKEGLLIYDPKNQVNNVRIFLDENGILCVDSPGELKIRNFNLTNDNIVYLNTNNPLIEEN